MQNLRFDLRDLFRAPRLAISLQRMWIQLLGMSVGCAVYFTLTFISLFLRGTSPAKAWRQEGLLPNYFVQTTPATWYSDLVYALAVLALVIAFLLTNTAVARAAYMSLKGNHFYSWKEAFAFAFNKLRSVVFAPLSLLVLGLLIVAGCAVLGWIGRLPYVGAPGIAILTPLWFLSALFLIYTIIVTVVSVWHTPGIIAASDEDAFEAVFQSFSLTWAQPWRLLLYQFVNMAITLGATVLFALLVKNSLMVMNGLFALFMGEDFIVLAGNGQAIVQNLLAGGQTILESLFGGFLGQIYFSKVHILHGSNADTAVLLSGYFYSAGLLFLAGLVFSFGFACSAIGNLLSFLVLRKRKDGENLLERRDREEEFDHRTDEELHDGLNSTKGDSI